MNKIVIYGVNISNLSKNNLILNNILPYFEFNNIKSIIQQYDFLIVLNDNIIFDELNIIELMEFIIKNDYDQILFDDSMTNSLKIMDYDYYKRIIKSNRIFKNLTVEDLKQKNIPNNYKPFQCILQPSIIRTKNFILPNFFLKRNPHIENLYWKELVKNGFKISFSNYYIKPQIPKNYSFRQEFEQITIVTGYLNIKIKRPAKSNTQNQIYDYIEKSRGTLQIPNYMVIYSSEDLIEIVYKIREEYGLQDKTKIIKITLENNLYMSDKLELIRKNVEKNTTPYDIPEYILAVNSRYNYIKDAIDNNYFNTNYFAWIDFSASHIVNIPLNKIVSIPPNEKIRIGWIARYSNNEFVYNHYCLGGGVFSGHKEIMMELIKLHHEEFVKLTEMGYNINDDKLLFIIMEQNPYLFDTYFSDYKNLFIRL